MPTNDAHPTSSAAMLVEQPLSVRALDGVLGRSRRQYCQRTYDTHTHRWGESQRERDRDRETETERDRETDRETERDRERQRDRE